MSDKKLSQQPEKNPNDPKGNESPFNIRGLLFIGIAFAVQTFGFKRFNALAIFNESENFLLLINTFWPLSTNFKASLLPIFPAPTIVILFFFEKSTTCCKNASADSTVESLFL